MGIDRSELSVAGSGWNEEEKRRNCEEGGGHTFGFDGSSPYLCQTTASSKESDSSAPKKPLEGGWTTVIDGQGRRIRIRRIRILSDMESCQKNLDCWILSIEYLSLSKADLNLHRKLRK